MNDFVNGANQVGKITIGTANIVSSMNKMLGRQSLTRLASDTIFQMPTMFSSNMSTDEAMVIGKCLEKQYAAAVVSSMSLSAMDMDKFGDNFAAYLHQFHNNSDIPTDFFAMRNAFESATEKDVIDGDAKIIDAEKITLESAKEIPIGNIGLGESCWEITEEQVNMNKLNDDYLPFKGTESFLRTALSKMSPATESLEDIAKDVGRANARIERELGADRYNGITNTKGGQTKETQRVAIDKKGKPIFDKNGNPVLVKEKAKKNPDHIVTIPNQYNQIVNTQKLSALEPTMINVQVIAHGKGGRSGTQMVNNITLGVKCTMRMVQTDILIANMVDAATTSNPIFKFIKWTKGELKFRDIFFGIAESKKIHNPNNDAVARVLATAKKRKKFDNSSKWLGSRIMPNLTVILTTYEVEAINQICGVDLSLLHNALSLINKCYFLAFGIYDSESQTLQILFDGDPDFSYVTFDAMKSVSKNQNIDMSNLQNVMRLMNRR